jgi:hypothetical protein
MNNEPLELPMIKVEDNFFEQATFDNIVTAITNDDFPWFFLNGIANKEDFSDLGFYHLLYHTHCPKSSFADFIMSPILKAVEPKAILRCRISSYLKGEKIIHHAWHKDFDYPNNAFMLYLNTNDGYTSFKDGTKIDCVANRAVFFNPQALHRSSNCTDQERRLVFTMNYL